MERSKAITAILFLFLLLSACSTSHDFVITNRSRSPIEVEYEWKGCTAGSPVDVLRPGKLSVPEFEKGSWDWRPIDDQQLSENACRFRVAVQPNEALRVEHASGYAGHESKDSDLLFGIYKLRITGSNGTIILEGRQTQTSFKKNDAGDYVIDYE
ncbi:MAG: hypothetical protein AB7J13_13120 [Pyrinomonadaceae bacterium]